MNQQPQLQMLDNMYQAILDTGMYSQDVAFQTLMEYIANRLDFEESVPSPWLKADTYDKLNELFDLELLRQDQWDWLGELHSHRGLSLITGDYEETRKSIQVYTDHLEIVWKTKKEKIQRFLNPNGGCGRTLLVIAKMFPETIYYVAEDDLLAYRILLLNTKIYNVRAVVLRANSAIHDLREYSPNWRYANRWTPVKYAKMLSEEEIDERTDKGSGTYRFV